MSRCGMPAAGAPLDTEMLVDAEGHAAVVTIEDRMRDGGIGMAIADRVRAIDPEIAVRVLGPPTQFVPPRRRPMRSCPGSAIDPARVAKAVKELGGAFLD
jgi:deoxyxylulose-5-phosphate synthase